ncbi:MAG: RdgB/HAM1 family non-canonical purine NTP pyrophosphatase [Candidatus Bipolaricaulota bacterium]|nr:RdgB/HAM1 family non-canonical purine NTP pyrophosphatase [Candidatus Bipolaricaulota bacterium]
MILLLGTRNEGKIEELKELLADLEGVELLTFHERSFHEVEETGSTFRENALLKARSIGQETGFPVLADDSGLEVASLNGEPGVRSARFSGVPVDYARNNTLLLERLKGVEDRRARFVIVIVLRLPDGREFLQEGTLDGKITRHLIGAGGFGYDPLFIPDGSSLTLAEIMSVEKNAISHRQRAIVGIKKVLRDLLQN